MKPISLLLAGAAALGLIACAAVAAPPPAAAPAPAAPGKLVFNGDKLVIPKDRDRWITLGTTFALSYEGDGGTTFNTVRADPASYDAFIRTGKFPAGAMLDLEVRRPMTEVAPAKGGKTQGPVVGRSIHVKDEKAGPGTWTFYNYGASGVGSPIARTQACYTCHQEHAATDTVFTQYYPTMTEAHEAAAKAP